MTALLQQPEKNTFHLPRGERLRREMRKVFRQQRTAILRYLRSETKSLGFKDEQEPPHGIPGAWPLWDAFKLGARKISERMTPIISAVWDKAGQQFNSRVGLDPDAWSVVNPHTAQKIEGAALDFCEETNSKTSLDLDEALRRTHEELAKGIVEQGDALPKLTKRINEIFDGAEKWRARRIAQTETSRARHAAQDEAARQSGVVTGWRWLASADACETCLAIVARAPTVKLGQPFAVIGHNPTYSHIYYPPAHPHCNCTVTEVLDTEPQPWFHGTLNQPEPATYEEIDKVAVEHQELINSVFPPSRTPVPIPKPPPKPKPRAAPLQKPIAARIRQRQEAELEPPIEITPVAPPAKPEPEPAEEISDPIPEMPIEHFAQHAMAAAHDVPIEDRMSWDKKKIWIIDAWRQFQRMHPHATLAAFKKRLIEAQRADLLLMARSDMTQYLTEAQKVKEKESLIRYLNATFHFLLLHARAD